MTAPRPIRQMRLCAYGNCTTRFNAPHGQPHPAAYCSSECHRLAKQAAAKPAKPRVQMPRTPQAKKHKAISPASPVQREATRDRACIACGHAAGYCHPAHIISRASLTVGQDDERATVPLCPSCHVGYDEGGLSLLEHLEPHYRTELAFAVERYGLLRTLQRVTGQHWAPVQSERSEAA